MAALEKEHWFYRGKRAIVKLWINRLLTLKPSDRLIDIGCGTGMLVEAMRQVCRSFGVETSSLGLDIAREYNRKYIISGNILSLPLKDNCAKVVTALDVLEHIKDDRKALEELVRISEVSGIIVISVPACPYLMGDWDKSLGHFRRYRVSDFQHLLSGLPV
ncbi:MAG: class I SAM-dependent methyltransferase, partial [Candidatus Omnitrophica bacterium]|nr:class I SAM-dependent methyltransferase [Candidatus Omnitrophota bacterium]